MSFISFVSVSDCDSTDTTDSSEDVRRGRSRPSKLDKVRNAHLFESNFRVSPRCHASTKSLGISNQPDIDDLEEAYLFQDEKDLGLSTLSSLPPYLNRDENSNDSFSSSNASSAIKSESQSELSTLARTLDTLLQDPGDLAAPVEAEPAKMPPTRSRISSEQLLSPKKVKKKKKVSVDGPGYEPLDQLVADNIDPVLLDCLEDELPTVPGPLLESTLTTPLELLDTYSTCKSMSVCNSRWLRPNNRDSVGSARKESKNKKVFDPLKPKRVFIYKDDLPGFSLDGDMEEEKLPVSKRRMAKDNTDTKSGTPGEGKKKNKLSKTKTDTAKSVSPAKDEEQSDEDLESVESFSSSSSV